MIGVVDLGEAQKEMRETLGLTKTELNEVQQKEAARIAVLERVTSLTKSAGAQQRDFGEQIKAASVFVQNLTDNFGAAIASSR